MKKSIFDLQEFKEEIKDGKYNDEEGPRLKWLYFEELVSNYQKEYNILFQDMPKQDDQSIIDWINTL